MSDLFNEIADLLGHGIGGKTTSKFPEMTWWVERAKQNGELKRLPGESKSAWRKRIKTAWTRFADKYDLNRYTGKPKHRSGNLGRVDGPAGMPDWLKKREKQIKGKPLRG